MPGDVVMAFSVSIIPDDPIIRHNAPVKERIQKLLANAGVASRRHVEEMVLQGRVGVNGRIVRDLPILINPETDKVEVDGERIKLASKTKGGDSRGDHQGARLYFLLNKPRGVYSTNVAQGAQTRAIDLLPQNLGARVYPVGRLDAESKGLLLLTNDGELTNQLTHPRYGVTKTYRAVVDGAIDPRTLEQVEKGMWLADKGGKGFKTGRSHIRIVKRTRERSILEVSVKEGRDPQLRRTLARLGHKVRDLTRTRLGPLSIEGLPPGKFRPLTPKEVRQLRKLPNKAARSTTLTRSSPEDEGET